MITKINPHTQDFYFNSAIKLNLHICEDKIFRVFPELIKRVFSHLQISDLRGKAALINKACYVMAHDVTLPAFRWILLSEEVKKMELVSSSPFICYTPAPSFIHTPHVSTAQLSARIVSLYGMQNYWKRYCENEQVKLLTLAADQGKEEAIEKILIDYVLRSLTNAMIGKEGLRLAEKYARQGSEQGIKQLLDAHLYGLLGLNQNDPIVQERGLKLAFEFAEQKFEAAIKVVLNAHKMGTLGLVCTNPEIQQKGLALTKKYADQRSEAAIAILLEVHNTGGFGLNSNDPKVQATGLELAKHYADEQSETAIFILLDAYQNNDFELDSEDPQTQAEGLRLLQKYAERESHEAFQFMLDAYFEGAFGLNYTDPNIHTEAIAFASYCAQVKSSDGRLSNVAEIAIDRLIQRFIKSTALIKSLYSSTLFELSPADSANLENALALAKDYLALGSTKAREFLTVYDCKFQSPAAYN